MAAQLCHHLKAGSLSSQTPLQRLSVTCFIHHVSSQGLAKRHVRKMRVSMWLRELWQVQAGGCQSLMSSLDTKKRQRDNNPVARTGIQVQL